LSLVGLLTACAGGCKDGWEGLFSQSAPKDVETFTPPAHVAGTVAEYASLYGGASLEVQGYGIVLGLGQNGSAEVPPRLRAHFRDYLRKRNLGSALHGTKALTPSRILADKDTAIVLVGGSIPPGAPVGSRFDVFVSALPRTQTRNLDGGKLMPMELSMALGGMAVVSGSVEWAAAEGAIFVNPFIDPTKPSALAKLRTGRILNGGQVTKARPIRLVLRQADYARCSLIERRINGRFPRWSKVANARNSHTLEIHIPRVWQKNYGHFLNLITHLPLTSAPGAWEAKAKQVADAMKQPGAKHEDLSLVWEAMGRQVVPIIQPLYASNNQAVAFYSARAGLRLGDYQLAEGIVLKIATSSGSRYQIPAIRELGRHRKILRAAAVLTKLIDDPNDGVRIAAYEALLSHGNRSRVRRINIDGQFQLDLVASARSYVIYATQTGQPRIVLFGRNMTVQKPIFFNSPDDLVTVNARTGDKKMSVFRMIPRSGKYSETFKMDFFVRTMVEKMGRQPRLDNDGNVRGLGLMYGQVVGVLYRMCKEKDIRAKFVLQPLPGVQRIYSGAVTKGRPD